MSQQIVINECFGGFGMSEAALEALRAGGWTGKSRYDVERNDPRLVAVVKDLGKDASDRYSNLVVVEVPDDVKWHIHEYDGSETVHEDHRSWGSEGLLDYGC